jgi:hypothetical protein
MLGKLATQLAADHLVSAEISYQGEIAGRNVGVLPAAIQGLLEPISARPSISSTRGHWPNDAAWTSSRRVRAPRPTTPVWSVTVNPGWRDHGRSG